MVDCPNLLLITGNGRESGKTTAACRLILQFRHLGITALKISSHRHTLRDKLEPVRISGEYSIFREMNPDSEKDSSRMLRSGAEEVFYISSNDDSVILAFQEVMMMIPSGSPVICESPALSPVVDPGVMMVMINENIRFPKDLSPISDRKHLRYTLSSLPQAGSIPVEFRDGKWIFT